MVKCKIKDWKSDWSKTPQREPIKKTDKDYIRTIGMMESGAKGEGTRWLAGIVDQVIRELLSKIPSLEMNSGKNRK